VVGASLLLWQLLRIALLKVENDSLTVVHCSCTLKSRPFTYLAS